MASGASNKVVIVVGAGGTLADASSKSEKDRPPLDRGFFAACQNHAPGARLDAIRGYLESTYHLDPRLPEFDSLEQVMCTIFADLHANKLSARSLAAFRHLIRLFNERIASTTNKLSAHKNSSLLRIVAKKLEEGCSPGDITIVTFNQDIQIEKCLEKLEEYKKYKKHGSIFSFPHCYKVDNASEKLSKPPKEAKIFAVDAKDKGGISILKLHGSLNWYSTHTSADVPRASILSRDKRFRITPRKEILSSMRMSTGKRKLHTFPLIVPPVTSKSSMIHQDLDGIWTHAEEMIAAANELLVFGYSCPQTDYESANLLRRSTARNSSDLVLSIIDPNPHVLVRYASVTGLQKLRYYRSVAAYLA